MDRYIVRYGIMRHMGVFTNPQPDGLSHGTQVLIRTSRGMETGVVLCPATERAIERLEPDYEEDRIFRVMNREDHYQARRIRLEERGVFRRCQKIMEEMNMEMTLVRIEHVFGGERIIIYYVADGRIDFRELVKALAAEFQTRIEMRQIGVRDETKLLADLGDCGRDVCCNSYLIVMPPVSMKMAKIQKATLDPIKISGRCGRLKCCLRYEYDNYAEIQDQMPPIGRRVHSPDGIARVVSHEILQEKVYVEFSDHTRKAFSAPQLKLLKSRDHTPVTNILEDGETTFDCPQSHSGESVLADTPLSDGTVQENNEK